MLIFQVKTKRFKKDSVLSKHRKWLVDLQATKDRLEIEYLEEMKRKEDTTAKFQEQAKKNRISIVSKAYQSVEEQNLSEDKPETEISDSKVTEILQQARQQSLYTPNILSDEPKTSIKSVKYQSKPAWALSAKAADEKHENDEMNDEDDLLLFANNLNYDKYINDIEIQSMVEQIKNRIKLLETELLMEEKKELYDTKESASRREMLAMMVCMFVGSFDCVNSGLFTKGIK